MLKKIMTQIMSSTITLTILILFQAIVLADTGSIYIDGTHEYKAVRLTPEIYNKSNRDLSDILILDEQDVAVPYFIHSFETFQKDTMKSIYPLDFADSFVKGKDYYADFYMEGNEQVDLLATSIMFQTNTSVFAKNIKLSGSFDGINWDFIQNDALYRVDDNEKLSITFNKPLKYTNYRYKMLDNVEDVVFYDVSLEYNPLFVEKIFFTETFTPKFQVEEVDNVTVIKLFGLKNVNIDEMTIDTNSQFKRQFRFAGDQTKTLYNLNFGDTVYKDTTLVFNRYSQNDDTLEIRINNGSDTPIKIDKITTSYFAEEIIFKGQNNMMYTLFFGDDTSLEAPIYDIINYKDFILKDGYDVLIIKDIETSDVIESQPTADYSTAFNIVIVIVSFLLGFVIIAQLKRFHR